MDYKIARTIISDRLLDEVNADDRNLLAPPGETGNGNL